MWDIVDKFGVSSVMVLKVLNDKDGVSGELKEKIKVFVVQMGYWYNVVVCLMKEGLIYNIGVIILECFIGFI